MAFKPFASFEFAGYQITLHNCVLLGAINNNSLDICVVFEVTVFQVGKKADNIKTGSGWFSSTQTISINPLVLSTLKIHLDIMLIFLLLYIFLEFFF